MIYNSDKDAYFGVTSNGQTVRVESDEMAEAAHDAGLDNVNDYASIPELNSPDQWANLIGTNPNVSYV